LKRHRTKRINLKAQLVQNGSGGPKLIEWTKLNWSKPNWIK